MKVRNGTGAKGSDQVVVREETTGNRRTPTRATDKPFSINKLAPALDLTALYASYTSFFLREADGATPAAYSPNC
jgi:hypothetical protein